MPTATATTPRWRLRFADNREARNWNLVSLALTVPLLLVGYYYYGPNALRTALAGAGTALLCDWAAGRLILRRRTLDDWSALVTGLWVACMLPAEMMNVGGLVIRDVPVNTAPLYAAAGAAFAILVVKIPFGGAMTVPFSPAAAGFAFLTVCFPQKVFAYVPSILVPSAHKSSLALLLRQGRSALGGGQLSGVFMGQSVGPLGTGCMLVICAALLAMCLMKARRGAALSAAGLIASVAVFAFLFPRVTGTGLSVRLHSVGMELFSGSLLFAAVFLLPEPGIMPNRWYTRLGYGAAAGALCLLLRHLGSYEESVCFAVLLANAVVPLLYRLQTEIDARREHRRKREGAPARAEGKEGL